jgi:hypothetical protein
MKALSLSTSNPRRSSLAWGRSTIDQKQRLIRIATWTPATSSLFTSRLWPPAVRQQRIFPNAPAAKCARSLDAACLSSLSITQVLFHIVRPVYGQCARSAGSVRGISPDPDGVASVCLAPFSPNRATHVHSCSAANPTAWKLQLSRYRPANESCAPRESNTETHDHDYRAMRKPPINVSFVQGNRDAR